MIRVRRMGEDDIEAVSAVRVGGWKAAYRGLVPQHHLDGLDVADDVRTRREMFARSDGSGENLVAEVEGDVVGWAAFGPSREEDRRPQDGELFALYVRPDLVGTGVGRALIEQVHANAARRPFRRLVLWVIAGNVTARTFYEKAGYVADGTASDWDVDGEPVPEVRYLTDLGIDLGIDLGTDLGTDLGSDLTGG